jgi:glycosyltransferase involved in cell wall biosynthesis
MREEKGIKYLIEIAKYISKDTQILLAGENWLPINISNLMSEKCLIEKFIIHDNYIPENQVDLYYLASDYVLILHEQSFNGLSGVLLQAIQYEVPIIALGPSETSHFVISNSIGCEINHNNLKDIENIINQLKTHSDALNKNILTSKQKYGWGKVILEYLQLYNEIN